MLLKAALKQTPAIDNIYSRIIVRIVSALESLLAN
jgi:hypothetical protein